MSQLRLEKDDLYNLPYLLPPDGYVVRNYRDGDEVGIAQVFVTSSLSDDLPESVLRILVRKPCFRPERVFIVEHACGIVATASAWVEEADPDSGYLHMVGVLPEHRGKRLGALVSVAAIRYSRDEGISCVRLLTDDWREAALKTYIGLGFYPLYADDTHPQRWAAIASKFERPDLLSRARAIC